MDNTYLLNLDLLKKQNEDIVFGKLDNCRIEDGKLTVYEGGKRWQLESVENMKLPVQIWCDSFINIKKNTVFAIFGLGKVDYVLEMCNRYANNLIIVYEPDESVLQVQLSLPKMTDLLNKDNLFLICGKDRKKVLCRVVDEQLDYKNGFDMQYASIPNYKKIFEEEWKFFQEQITLSNVYLEVSRNTKVYGEEVRGKCYLYNIYDLIKEAGIDSLYEAFHGIDLQEIPAVIISAGPSLDKNINVLKDYQNKVFIICVDSAICTVLKYGLTPDLLICVDPIKNPDLFKNDLGQNIPMITHLYCNYQVTKENKARKFYCSDREMFEKTILEDYGKTVGVLATGGTVANVAFSFLQSVGFQTIIMIGQDLAYPDKRLHTEEAHDEVDFEKQGDRFFYVKDIYGNPVLSEYNMCMYRKWFEEQVIKYPELTIVDATEGGALIEGTKIMTLANALQEYSIKNKPNFSEVIQNAKYLFTDQEQERIKKELDNIMASVQTISDNLARQLKVYDELDQLNRKGKYETKQFQRCIERISDFNKSMDNEKAILLLQLFANKGDFEVNDKLQEENKSQYEEIKLIVDIGRQLIETYVDAEKKLSRALEEVFQQNL